MTPRRIGLIGLDTSHVSAFANLLHDPNHPFHVPGGRIVSAFPGGSEDFEASISRVSGYTEELREKHGVAIVSSIAQLRDTCDAIFIESIDGRVHLEQFRQVANWNVPVFIDKPLTISTADASSIANLAATHGTRVMTASSLRFSESFRAAFKNEDDGAIIGGDFFGPMPLVKESPGFFWYGIHLVELLYATLGQGCHEVKALRQGPFDLIIGKWTDGRVGTLRGNRTGNKGFGGVIHREKRSRLFEVATAKKPIYASLLDNVLRFLGGEPSVPMNESVEIIRFIEAANKSVETGRSVSLNTAL